MEESDPEVESFINIAWDAAFPICHILQKSRRRPRHVHTVIQCQRSHKPAASKQTSNDWVSCCHSSQDFYNTSAQTTLLILTQVDLREPSTFTFGLWQGSAISEQVIANARPSLSDKAIFIISSQQAEWRICYKMLLGAWITTEITVTVVLSAALLFAKPVKVSSSRDMSESLSTVHCTLTSWCSDFNKDRHESLFVSSMLCQAALSPWAGVRLIALNHQESALLACGKDIALTASVLG